MTLRLAVLLGVLAVVAAGALAHNAFERRDPTQLSASETREARAQLARATFPASYSREKCPEASLSVCFTSKRPLEPLSARSAFGLVTASGVALTDVTRVPCDSMPPTYRQGHLLNASVACMGVASLGRFVASFSVISTQSDCRALKSLVGTRVQLTVGGVGKVDHDAIADLIDVRRAMKSDADASFEQVMAHARVKTRWPADCRTVTRRQ